MPKRSKLLAILALILTACVPYTLEAVSSSTTKTDVSPAQPEKQARIPAITEYLQYLQAKRMFDFDKAYSFLNEALRVDPNNKMLMSEMFNLLTIEGKIEQAYPFAKAELKENPTSLLASLVTVTYHVLREEYDEALKLADDFPDKRANEFFYSLLEVWIRAGLKDKDKAVAALETLNQSGTEAMYYFHSALLYDLWGDADKAAEGYEALLREPGGLSLRAAQAYGNFLLRQGENKKFKALLDAYHKGSRSYPLLDETFFTAGAVAANKKVPRSVPNAKSGLAEAFFDISGSLADKASPETSLVFTRFSLALDPSLSLARVLLGELYEKQGRLEDALKLYKQEKESSETYYASQVRVGILLAKRGDLKRAEQHMRNLAEKRPDSAFPWIELGEIFISNQKFSDAVDAFTEALKRIQVPNRSHWLLYYSRGVAYERDKKWDLAEQDLLQALILFPEQPLTLNYLGYSWIERGKNVTKAREMLERAAFLSPQEGFIVDSLGWSYYLLKKYDRAVNVLENAVSLDPGSAVINDHLGDAYWRVGRTREARFQWTKSLALKDDFADNDRDRVSLKLEKGLDEVGDKPFFDGEKKQPKKIKTAGK